MCVCVCTHTCALIRVVLSIPKFCPTANHSSLSWQTELGPSGQEGAYTRALPRAPDLQTATVWGTAIPSLPDTGAAAIHERGVFIDVLI